MTIRFELGLCTVSAGLPIAPALWTRLAAAIGEAFTEGSSGEIRLKVSRIDASSLGVQPLSSLSDDDLQKALFAWTGDQRGMERIERLGLLLGGSYEGQPDHFGYMFDKVFRPNTSNPWLDTPAREGCVVFANAIARNRAGADFADELIFTAIHELGHVFNLQHDEPPDASSPTFMMRSASVSKAFDLTRCRFDDPDRHQLAQCASSPYVYPGGSNFEILGPFGAGNRPLAGSQRGDDALTFRISTMRSAYWFFEPIELDLEVCVSSSSPRRSASVPDMLDPGYSLMAIWIEEPSGTRRRYRSPRRYCAHGRRKEVSVEQPIRRDVSIFAQAGGYTFREVGIHRIFATWQVSATRVLRSNVIEIEILAPARSVSYRAAENALVDIERAVLMYRRRLDARRLRKLKPLHDFCSTYPTLASSAMISYGLGRAYARQVVRAAYLGLPVAAYADRARMYLKAALANEALGERRHEHCEVDMSRVTARSIQA